MIAARQGSVDLEAMAGADLEPEYVLALLPPLLCASLWRQLTEPSYWELFTVAEWLSGMPSREAWRTPGNRRWTEQHLALWVRGVLGFPVALEACWWEAEAGRRTARLPLYQVRRDT
jgi:hypothetical protein